MFLGLNSDTWQIIGAVIAAVLLFSGAIAFIVRMIFKAGQFSQRLNDLEGGLPVIKTELQTTRKDLTDRIDSLITLFIQKNLSESNSPRQLNAEGKKVLENSGIAPLVEEKFDEILKKVEDTRPENAYQAEKVIFDVVDALIEDEAIKDAVENGAFQSGYPVAGVLFVGGLYIRDRVLKELGFTAEEIDKHVPRKSNKPKAKK